MIKHISFDFEGTLADSLPLCINSFKLTLKELDIETTEDRIKSTLGASEEGALRILAPNHGDQALIRYLKNYDRLYEQFRPKLFDGIEDLLLTIDFIGLDSSLITCPTQESARISLERLGLAKYFKTIHYGSPLERIKSKCMNAVMTQFKLNSAEFLYVGNTTVDYHMCNKAGVQFVGAMWSPDANITQHPKPWHFVHFSSPDQLSKWLLANLLTS
jgi:phosphoglycolate phosphatase-like HAD superfamily hydrolase